MNFEAWATVIIVTGWLTLFGYLLSGLRDEEQGLSNGPARPPKNGGGFFAATFHPLRKLGDTLMDVIEQALARLDAFVKGVLVQVKGVKETNDTQTAKLAELQAKLDAATSDDAADKAEIASLQEQVSTLQASVASQINSVVDSLEAVTVTPPPVVPPVVETPTADAPVVEDPVVDAPVVEEPVVDTPVVEEPVVDTPVVEDVPVVDQPTDPPVE